MVVQLQHRDCDLFFLTKFLIEATWLDLYVERDIHIHTHTQRKNMHKLKPF